MRLLPLLLGLALLLQAADAYYIKQSREQLLDYYFAHIDDKVPPSARMLIGDEKINVYIGNEALGIETRRGQLYYFETAPVEKATTTITISEDAAEKISQKKMGIIEAIDNGGIKIQTTNLLSALKMEMIKRIYAISGADDRILGKKPAPLQPYTQSSIYYVRKARITG